MNPQALHLPLSLTVEEIYPYLGITDDTITPSLHKLIGHYIRLIIQSAQPAGVWKNIEISELRRDRIILENSELVIEGSNTVSHFQTCSSVTLLAATLGLQTDDLLLKTKNSQLEILVCDSAASAAAENITEQLDIMISREILRQGLYPTSRFSPGYGDWPLSWQKEFIQSVDAGQIGLTVSPHFLLQPIKSVTAVIGLSRIPVTRNYTTPQRQKPCKGSFSCSACPLGAHCPDKY